ncbi:MAG: NUDIX domain-containing protein [Planctomycetes bacterium]|nr:NUDIX domain-containing protein [Planctomycetota bacterium]
MRNAHCSYCGQAFDRDQAWPRVCGRCGETTYQNPIPVSVVLLPVDGGLLAIRRGIEPALGRLALPGGYVNWGETWQEAGAREVLEETGIRLDPSELREFRVRSAGPGLVLLFSLAGPRRAGELPPFHPTDETTERVVLTVPQALAFPLHTEAMRVFFENGGSDRR